MDLTDKNKLSVIIPAYNEEEAIASIINRSLEAVNYIVENSPISSVEIIVVNDGSHDYTAEIAKQYVDIILLSHDKNRGYGAAIKTGFEKASGDILGFLDADGTCDPNFFADLCTKLIQEDNDIVIGSRMNSMSEMPKVRRLGNWIFAKTLSLLSNKEVTDSASGMRVIKRDSLYKIYPLPDGLHFTPAMSSRALLDRNISISEIPMSYSERMGRSKLSVLKDGLRFSKVILYISMTHRPFKLFGTLGFVFLIIAFFYGIGPTYYYIQNSKIAEYMIYRFITIAVLTLSGINLIILGILSDHIVALINDYKPWHGTKLGRIIDRFFFRKPILLSFVFGLGAIALNIRTIHQYVFFHQVTIHWIYVLVGALLALSAVEIFAYGILKRILVMLREKREFEKIYKK